MTHVLFSYYLALNVDSFCDAQNVTLTAFGPWVSSRHLAGRMQHTITVYVALDQNVDGKI